MDMMNRTGSAIGPIIVMIDASRLGHSLATALKDRPHGIPVQPNRSLPLRPPPPPPARISVSKSPKSSSLTPSPTPAEARSGKDSRKRLSVDGDSTREGSLRIDNVVSGMGVMGMNFYDSQDKNEQNSRRIPDQSRHSKSLDHDEFDDTSSVDSNRRKSLDSETISRHGKRNSFNSDLASPDAIFPKEKKRRGSYAKKRKLSSDDNSDGSRKEKSSKLQKIAPKSKSTSNGGVESSNLGLPTIIKFRHSKASRIDAETRKTSFAPILPKPASAIPECPAAIPIELAQAINLNDSTSSESNAVANEAIAPLLPKIPKIRIVQNGRRFSRHVEDIENTLPSMPSLDLDALNENNNGKNGANAARQPMANGEAKLSKELSSKMNYNVVQKDVDSIQDKMSQSYSDVSLTNQTMVQIHVLSYSNDLIIMSTPQIISNGNMVGTIEATVPDTLSPITKNGEDTTKLNDVSINQKQYQDLSGREQLQYMLQNKDTTRTSADTSGIPQNDECGAGESMVGKPEETRTESHQDRSKTDREKIEIRKQRFAARLQKFNEEKEYLELNMSQTTDPSRLTRLQQKMNCAIKKIENTKKYLDRLISFQTPTISADPPQSRIQVRQDLVDTTTPENVEPVRRSPFVPCLEADESPVAMSPQVSSPLVITISETDSASSDEEGYVIDERVSDNVKPAIKTQPDVKIEWKHVPTMNVKGNSSPSPRNVYPAENTLYPTRLPDVEVQPVTSIVDSAPLIEQPVPLTEKPQVTNNNVEYINKNLQSDSDRVSAGGNEVIKRIPPLIRDPISNSSNNMNPNTEQKSPNIEFRAQQSSNVEYRAQNLNPATGIFEKVQITSVVEKEPPDAGYRIQFDLNSVPEKLDGVKPDCSNCAICLGGSKSVSVRNQNQSQIGSSKNVNSYIPTSVIDQTLNQENINSHQVTNYPGHQTEYRAQGNVSSMFSRDNGGANINLSSPLQGHSALPLPLYSQRNLTAQGYPLPGENSPNYQATQWYNQQPGSKLPPPFTPDQDGATYPSILASHLLKLQAQEPSNVSRQTKLPSLMTEQFPTLANWAAQMTRDPTPRNPVSKPTSPQINANTHPVIQHSNGPKATGSDMYKMTASAVDARHPAAGSANGIHWQPARAWTDQQRPPPPPYTAPKSNTLLYTQNYQNIPQNTQNCYMPTPRQHGPVYLPYPKHPYRQSLSAPQGSKSTEYPTVPHNKQSPYYPPPSTIQQPVPVSYQNQGQMNNTSPAVNSLAMMQNKYIQPVPYSSQDPYRQWLAPRNYPQQQYLNSQYNGYGTQAKPADNSTRYAAARPRKKNTTAVIVTRETMQRREQMVQSAMNATLPMSRATYNERVIQPNRVVMDGLNEPLDLGRSSTIAQSVTVQNIPSRLNNVKCSLCGMNDPKFNCTDCKAAFYCNQKCQAQHWRTHVLECSQRLPKLQKVS